MIYNYKDILKHKQQLIDSFKEADELFKPRLFQRITSNNKDYSIEDYIDKLNINGDIFIYIKDNKIMGVVAVYTNDKLSCTAFIPILFVLLEHQGKGIARKLLIKVKQYSKAKAMKFIRVNTWIENNNAISLYVKNKFKILEISNSNVQLIAEL